MVIDGKRGRKILQFSLRLLAAFPAENTSSYNLTCLGMRILCVYLPYPSVTHTLDNDTNSIITEIGNFPKQLFHHWLLPEPQAVTRQMKITELNKEKNTKEQQKKAQEAKRYWPYILYLLLNFFICIGTHRPSLKVIHFIFT
jgi:hypothetical protein